MLLTLKTPVKVPLFASRVAMRMIIFAVIWGGTARAQTPTPTATPFPVPGTFPSTRAQTLTAPMVAQASPAPNGSIVQHVQTIDPAQGGRAIYTINVAEPGYYWLRASVNWLDGGSNSVFAAFGALPENSQVWTGFDFTDNFETRYFTDPPDFTTRHVFFLSAGITTLDLVGREADTFIGDITIELVDSLALANYEPYFFNTFAGPAGARSTAQFYFPEGVAVDSAHNIYVADTGNSTIRKITPDGSTRILAGSPGSPGGADGTGSSAQFSYPQGVVVDSNRNVYVADTYNQTIRKITPTGIVSTLAGLAGNVGSADGTGNAARFNYPEGVAVDSASNLYVADTYNNTIRKITPAGDVSTLAGLAGIGGSTDGSGSNARFKSPQNVTVDGAGNVLVADSGNSTIRKISSSGAVSTFAGLAGSVGSADGTGNAARFSRPKGVTMTGSGDIYVADTGNFTIRKITSAGVVSTVAGSPGSSGSADRTGSDARFNGPEGVAVDDASNVYVADSGNHTIRSVSSTGVVVTVAGVAGSHGSIDRTNARFVDPRGVAVDSAHNVYVADTGECTIRKIAFTGEVSTLAGLAGSIGSADGTGSAARFYLPRGVAVDEAGNVYVADTDNHTIRKITPDGAVNTLAGLAGSSGSADGNGTAARFNSPNGVAVDSAGNVYVADYFNETIRKITPAGIVTTLAGLPGSMGSADGTGSAARFNDPSGVTVDSAGNVYVADTHNSTIRKITPAGQVSTLAGLAGSIGSADGSGSVARFAFPAGVTVDSAGYVYVADTNASTIRKITPVGQVSTLAGLAGSLGGVDGTGSAARFSDPIGIAVDSSGNVYVGDRQNVAIRKITPDAVVSTLAGLLGGPFGSTDGSGSAARFSGPHSVALDTQENIYLTDSTNHTIRKISRLAVVTTLAGLAGTSGSADGHGNAARFFYPSGVATDSAGNSYVGDGNYTIRKITPTGDVTTLAGSAFMIGSADGIGSAARFGSPKGVAVSSSGNIYVADYGNSTIRKITPAGEVSTLAGLAGNNGSADGTGSSARFNYPRGIAVDNSSNVYVADTENNTIRKISPAGTVSTLAGLASFLGGSVDGTGSAARFAFPTDLEVDTAGNVYVADGNSTIRKITPAGVVTTLAGLALSYGSADGTGSAARFGNVTGVAVGGDGKLYVADFGNNAIRKGAPPPFIESPPIATGTVGIQFVYQIQAQGATSFNATNLPPGLLVDTTLGIIYGTPSTVMGSPFQVMMSASDGQHTTTTTLTIMIQPAPVSGPVIESGASVTGRTGGFFAFDVITSEGATITASALPPGLTINSMTGLISGTPTSDNSSLVTLTAGTHVTTLQLTFLSNSAVPIISSPDNATLVPGRPFSHTLTADAAATFSLFQAPPPNFYSLPPGLSFNSQTATISGTYTGTIITPPPDTIKIRPPCVAVIQTNAHNVNGTGTRPLNFYQAVAGSRKSDGQGGTLDIPLPLTGNPGIECRSGGANGDYQVVFAFPNPVSFSNASVTPGPGGSANVVGFSTNAADGKEVLVNLTNVSNGQQLTVTLSGVSGGTSTVSVQMGILVGDVTGNGTINSSDVSFVKLQSGQPISASNYRADVTGNGVINGSDVSLVKSRSGMNLPTEPARQ